MRSKASRLVKGKGERFGARDDAFSGSMGNYIYCSPIESSANHRVTIQFCSHNTFIRPQFYIHTTP